LHSYFIDIVSPRRGFFQYCIFLFRGLGALRLQTTANKVNTAKAVFLWRGFVIKSTPLIPRQRGKLSILPLWRGQGGGKSETLRRAGAKWRNLLPVAPTE